MPYSRNSLRLWLGLLLAVALAATADFVFVRSQATRPGAVLDRQAQADLRLGLPVQAEQTWLQSLQRDPSYCPSYVHLGDFDLAHRRPRDAAMSYTGATLLQPSDGTLWLHLAQARQQENDIPGADAAALRATQLLPSSVAAWTLYGQLQERQNNIALAITALRQAHHLAPDDRTAALELARVEITEHEMDQAAQDFLPYLNAHPDDAESRFLLAGYYNELPQTPGCLRQALLNAQQAQALAPANPYAAALVGDIQLKQGQIAAASVSYQQALKLAPHSDRVLQGLLQCERRLGQTVQAAQTAAALQAGVARRERTEHLQDMLRFHPNDADALAELRRLQAQSGD